MKAPFYLLLGKKSPMKITLYLPILFVLIYACTKVPISGRKQMHLLPEASLIEMSNEEYASFLNNSQVLNYGPQVDQVKSVGAKLKKATEAFLKKEGAMDRIAGFTWEFNVVESPELNAWCMPGGKICFYTGILEITENEAGTAVVMGHEIAHAVARHGNERMSKATMVELGGTALNIAVAEQSEQARALMMSAYGVGANLGLMLPFSRKHELEADMMGLVLMQLAGYDAHVATAFWERMSAAGGEVPEFLSTHPSGQTRIQEIKSFLNSDQFYRLTH